MRRIENEEFDAVRKRLLALYKDKNCPVNRYFYYAGSREPVKKYKAAELFADFPLKPDQNIRIWAYGNDYILESRTDYFIEFMNLFKIWEIDALRMNVLLVFPETYDWLIVFTDDELDYKIFEFSPREV